jgi:prepilin-type N-terminal cleavage/methylation domain-containing protein
MYLKSLIRKRKKTKSNSGFSLIEVLLAVVLLGLIAAPILQMFYSSYAMNMKSKKYLAGADLLQTVMEGVSAQTWEDSKSVDGKVTLSGLQTYYSGLSVATDNKKLYEVYCSDAVGTITEISGAPTGRVVTKTTNGGELTGIKFSNVSYGGYKFSVEYVFTPPTVKTNKYWTENIEATVSLIENGTEKEIQSASTQITNKR